MENRTCAPGSTSWSTSGGMGSKAVRQLGAVAKWAVELRADAVGAPRLVEHPRCDPERRLVAYVLAVQAREVGHPVAVVVLAKTDDPPPHRASVDTGVSHRQGGGISGADDQEVVALLPGQPGQRFGRMSVQDLAAGAGPSVGVRRRPLENEQITSSSRSFSRTSTMTSS